MIRIIAILAIFTGSAAGQVLRLAALDGSLGDGIPPVIERFLGEDATIAASFLRVSEATINASADVHLSGGSLAAPLLRGLRFQPVAVSRHPALLEGVFTIPHPETAKPNTQFVVIYALSGDSTKVRVGSFSLRWVSTEECKTALTRLLAGGNEDGARLLVFGTVLGLREQLRSWRISFDDGGKEAPLRIDTHCTAIGDDLPADAPLPSMPKSSSLLLIRVQAETGTMVLQHHSPGVRVTQITISRAMDWRRSPFLIRQLTEQLTPTAP